LMVKNPIDRPIQEFMSEVIRFKGTRDLALRQLVSNTKREVNTETTFRS
jgi:hypothetical protein